MTMTSNGQSHMGLDRFEAALETYGADRTRWPAPLRHALSGLIATSPEAQKLLQEAEAFDRLLDLAPNYDVAGLGELRDRIAMAAERQPRLVSNPGNAFGQAAVRHRQHGLAAAALAASLVLGVFAGQSSMIRSLVGDVSNSASSSQQLAQVDDADSLLDEDLL